MVIFFIYDTPGQKLRKNATKGERRCGIDSFTLHACARMKGVGKGDNM